MVDTEKIPVKRDSSGSSGDVGATHREDIRASASGADKEKVDGNAFRRRSTMTAEDKLRSNMNAKIANPLAGYKPAELEAMAEEFARDKVGLTEDEDIQAFRVGARLAANPFKWDSVETLTGEDRDEVEREFTHKWRQPKTMYLIVVLCSMAAAVQGMDETVVNGAQLFYTRQFGIDGDSRQDVLLVGLVNSAPYLCCAVIGCWLTTPLNNYFGRRGTVFITCLISALTCFWQGFTNTWWHLFLARFFLGFGIGPKSATVPVFAAETAPPAIRGALVMQWQMWTAFGIMIGYVADLAFYPVKDRHNITGLNWRLMLGSALLFAVIVCLFVFKCPESPRWYLMKRRYSDAYKSIQRIRYRKVQAARDLFLMYKGLEAEEQLSKGKNRFLEIFTVPRNRRAMIGSEIVMFMQQFTGVNVLAYYSSQIFSDSGFSDQSALAASLGFGIINFLFAIPAIFTIDTFGRRNLLLTTFPLMALFHTMTGSFFYIPDSAQQARIGLIAVGIYLYAMAYSPGMGPVPFTYSAEAYPLYIRSLGMSLATATTWLFNWLLGFTLPLLLQAFTPSGAFYYYAAWNLVGWVLVLFFLPETKGKTLEELDQVFSVPTRKHAAYGARQVPYFIKRYIFRRDVKPEVLYEYEEEEDYDSSSLNQEKEPKQDRRV